MTLASGRSKPQKRALITDLTDKMERVLEVARPDIQVLLWELPRIPRWYYRQVGSRLD